MKLRIKNLARGERGVYAGKALHFVGSGQTRTFEDAGVSEINAAKANADFRTWQSEDGASWEEVTPEAKAPNMQPFLAIASGARGENMRAVSLAEGEWYLGTTLATDAPDGPQGYAWAKVGGVVADTPEPEPDYRAPTETLDVGPAEFDPAAFVSDKMPDVVAGIATMDAERVALVKEAELATEKPRKGVLTAIEEREEELMA